MKKVVYVAGPFTSPSAWGRELNVRAAEMMAMEVAKLGAMPLCPHTNTRFFEGTITPEFWYEGTLELLRRSDAMIVLPGAEAVSSGVRREVAEANPQPGSKPPRRLIPTFRTLADLAVWLDGEGKKEKNFSPVGARIVIGTDDDIQTTLCANGCGRRMAGHLPRGTICPPCEDDRG